MPNEGTQTKAVDLVGCPRCFMYVVMLSEVDPKCPKCKSTVFLEFFKDETSNQTIESIRGSIYRNEIK
ncbi:hypothetical protein JHK84_038242 [Glycine max]|uniref:GIR1-like zinc ribbon domain-containing protein n=1 Tax=Glycine max TaxID=3847 RepID=A0A0R0H5L3_SOYBN|nr:hypothetical protein JHK85_038584 [Glycine max]KAG5131845.1 hypothetical protein JHK84_038242 [Glycine max]KAH1104303.1 hypothetical protein GYH30_037957 [Glycine max]